MPADKAFDLRPYFTRMYDTSKKSLHIRPAPPNELREAQGRLKSALISAMNLPVYSSRDKAPLAESVSIEVCDGYTREKLRLEIAPELTVPLYILRPLKADGDLPVAIALCLALGYYDFLASARVLIA